MGNHSRESYVPQEASELIFVRGTVHQKWIQMNKPVGKVCRLFILFNTDEIKQAHLRETFS